MLTNTSPRLEMLRARWLIALALLAGPLATILSLFASQPALPALLPSNNQDQFLSGASPSGLSASDWRQLRDQIEASSYRAAADAAGYHTTNAAHGWRIRFGLDGTTRLTPRSPSAQSWQWGLRLSRYGAGKFSSVQRPQGMRTDGATLTYSWDSILEEWWLNTSAGLEQGFTLTRRPGEWTAGAPLQLELVWSGGLRAQPQDDGVAFIDQRDAIAFTYTKIRAWDARGHVLPAHIATQTTSLRLVVDDTGAIYPLTVDPILQQAYAKASNPDSNDRFGYAVALAGDTVVVGAPGEDSATTGVNGDESDNSATDAGAAYVFARSNGVWSQQAYLKAANAQAGDQFGWSVALLGDIAIVGAPGEDSAATSVNGDGSDNSATDAGAAYVFARSNGVWSQQAYLKAANAQAGDQLGHAVAMGNPFTVVVGAPLEDSAGFNPSDNSAADAGAAYVFQGSGANWNQQTYLKATNAQAGDQLGFALAADAQAIVAGAPFEDSAAVGVNGNQFNDFAPDSGAAYIFQPSSPTPQAYLKASNTGAGDQFGYAVAITDQSGAGETILVGAPFEDSAATFVNGAQNNEAAPNAGAAYLFLRGGSTWSQNSYLKASNTGSGDMFGQSVALANDWAAIGAPNEDSAAAGTDGDSFNNGAPNAGATYIYGRFFTPQSTYVWSPTAYLKASNTGPGDQFGQAVAIGGSWTNSTGVSLVIGAPFEDSGLAGINPPPNNEAAADAGAAYLNAWFLLYASPAGTGSGSITVNPAGFLQGPDTTVTARAVANTGSTFTGWSGDCSGLDDCLVTMTNSKSIVANFSLNQYSVLTATVGQGSVALDPPGGSYPFGTVVTLTASPNLGSTFAGWSGDLGGTTSPITLTMTGSRQVTATFGLNQYSVSTATVGQGSVALDPPGGSYPFGTVVTLTASPNLGSTFAGWSSDLGGTTSPITLTVTGSRQVTATFGLNPYSVLTATVGQGSVALDPPGGSYPFGTVVTLTASPNLGSTFAGWSGDLGGTTSPITLTVTSSRQVTATFTTTTFRSFIFVPLLVNRTTTHTYTANQATPLMFAPPDGEPRRPRRFGNAPSPMTGWPLSRWL
jgi:hypothetical protein